jgi:carboxyl-terminal processing protease
MGTRCVLHRTIAFAATAAAAVGIACSSSSAPPYARYAERCVSPRPGTSDVPGTLTDEKNWLKAWTDDLYLWYTEVPPNDPAAFATPEDYFNVLKTPLKTPSNNDKDRFHFFMSTAEWQAFANSGATVGYGIDWAIVAPSPPREVRVGYVQPNTPGANAQPRPLVRGTQIVNIDGQAVVNGDKDVLNAGLGPSSANPTHHFDVLYPDNTTASVTLTAVNVTENPVPIVKVFPGKVAGTNVGYILFSDFIATSEDLLVNAIKSFKGPPQVDELILDIRYNGGGFANIASELAYMISGPSTGGKTFEKLTFNNKHPSFDPVTGNPLVPLPFLTTAQGFSTPSNVVLPTLGLTRVFVLTAAGTCSASEAVMNGLIGVGVNVVQIGATTCGKPYGFYPFDNCATTYFSIQFQGVNAQGFGDYTDGFVPGGSGTGVAGVPGCVVPEDFAHELGDPADARIVAALNWAASQNTCSTTAAAFAAQQRAALSFSSADAISAKPPWRENRIMTPYQPAPASAHAP